MSSPFSAGPQALGYLYQARFALHELLSDERVDANIIIEGLDDISIEGEGIIKLDQLKHHVKQPADLTDYSVEIWKTIRVWSESLRNESWKPEEVTLNLITTGHVEVGSAADFLRPGATRDESKALIQLNLAAINSTNQILIPSFNSFKTLTETQKQRLIKAIYIIDAAPNIIDLISHIKIKLRRYTPPEFRDSLYERIEGWWFNKIVNHLMTNSIIPITADELDCKIYSIADQFKLDSLPIDYSLEEPDDDYFNENDDRIFVRQLNQIRINAKRIRFAVLDYYRAFEQRSRWTREQLIIDDELLIYEKRLKQEWERCIAKLEDDIYDFESDDDCLKFGRKVLNWMEQANIPIRSNMPINHEYVIRGSYHILSDMHPPSVYWHPKFINFLNTIITSKVNS